MACQMGRQQNTVAIKYKFYATSVLFAENYGAISGTVTKRENFHYLVLIMKQ